MTNSTHAAPKDNSWAPVAKVKAATLVGAIVVVVTWVLQYFAHVNLPMPVDTLTQFILMVLAAYFKKP